MDKSFLKSVIPLSALPNLVSDQVKETRLRDC